MTSTAMHAELRVLCRLDRAPRDTDGLHGGFQNSVLCALLCFTIRFYVAWQSGTSVLTIFEEGPLAPLRAPRKLTGGHAP